MFAVKTQYRNVDTTFDVEVTREMTLVPAGRISFFVNGEASPPIPCKDVASKKFVSILPIVSRTLREAPVFPKITKIMKSNYGFSQKTTSAEKLIGKTPIGFELGGQRLVGKPCPDHFDWNRVLLENRIVKISFGNFARLNELPVHRANL